MDIRHEDYQVMHYREAQKTLRECIASGWGEIEFTQLHHDDAPDHLEGLSSLYYEFGMGTWDMDAKGPADQYTKKLTYRGVSAEEVFMMTFIDGTSRSVNLIFDDVIRFTKCHLFDGKMRVRFVLREEN